MIEVYGPFLSFQVIYEILTYYRYVVVSYGCKYFVLCNLWSQVLSNGMFVNNETTLYETYSSSSSDEEYVFICFCFLTSAKESVSLNGILIFTKRLQII